jgi:hypothetical protein
VTTFLIEFLRFAAHVVAFVGVVCVGLWVMDLADAYLRRPRP